MVVTSMDIYWVFSFNNYDNDYNPLEIIRVLVPGGGLLWPMSTNDQVLTFVARQQRQRPPPSNSNIYIKSIE